MKYFLSLGIMFYSMTFGIFTKKGRSFLINILNFHNISFMEESIITNLQKIASDSVMAKDKIEMVESSAKDGNVTIEELAIINGIVKKENPNKIFEIGTFDGRTTINMAYNSKDHCKIFTLDLPQENLSTTKYKINAYDKSLINKPISGERILKTNLECKKKITQLYGDSASYDFSSYYNSIDLVFIDGAHDFNNALNDSITAIKLVNNNGIIIWHDYKNNMPVVKAVDSFNTLNPKLKIYHIQGSSLAYCKVELS